MIKPIKVLKSLYKKTKYHKTILFTKLTNLIVTRTLLNEMRQQALLNDNSSLSEQLEKKISNEFNNKISFRYTDIDFKFMNYQLCIEKEVKKRLLLKLRNVIKICKFLIKNFFITIYTLKKIDFLRSVKLIFYLLKR